MPSATPHIALAGVIGLACTPSTQRDSTWQEHTGLVDPHDYWSGFDWTGSSALDVVLDLDLTPRDIQHWEVRLCRSETWWGVGCDDYTTIAHSLSSLDGLLTEQGFVLTGVPDVPRLAPAGFGTDLHSAYLLTTPDMEHWGTRVEALEGIGEDWAIDTALLLQEDGQPAFVFYQRPIICDTTPEACPADHDIKRANWEGERFVVQAEPVVTGERWMDPTVVPYQGDYHLFATCDTHVCHAQGDDIAQLDHDAAFAWTGVQVPHANIYEGPLMVVGQGGGGWSQPRYLLSEPDGSFTSEDLPLWSASDDQTFFGGSCTSPVLIHWDQTYYTICAVLEDVKTKPTMTP